MHRHKSAPVILISIACFGAEAYYITDAKHVLDATNDDRNPAMVFGCGGMDVANKCGDCTWVQEVVINLAVDWDNPDVDEAIIDRPPANITCYKGKIGVQTPTDDGVCTAFENREGGIFQGTDWVYLVKERYGFGSEQACQAMSEVLYPADAGLQNKSYFKVFDKLVKAERSPASRWEWKKERTRRLQRKRQQMRQRSV